MKIASAQIQSGESFQLNLQKYLDCCEIAVKNDVDESYL